MAEVALEHVSKRYGRTLAVRGVDLRVAPGEFVTLLGPSGCGKTTCLRMVAGFVTPDEGRIVMAGQDVTATPPYHRNAGMVFQSYALFPHKTVAANVAFGMKVRGIGRTEMVDRTREALRLVRLEGLADRYPSELSGGQKQRVALARAVVIRPQVLLLDEPLGALDLKLREELQLEIKRVQSTLGITTLFVTHDQGEALGMSDRIAVMRDGEIVQLDAPQRLYERPSSRYVANFVGRTNLIEVTVVGREPGGGYRVAREGGATLMVAGEQHMVFPPGRRCLLAARPEQVSIGADQANTIEARVIDVTYRGNIWSVDLTGTRGEALTALLRPGGTVPAKGDVVPLTWTATGCFLLADDPDTSPGGQPGEQRQIEQDRDAQK
ncbi:MAG: ABC transporter ATP-binding protein [Hyphomicrobiales bacterium]|nr:ABC transporter ATP-binding protein [Hyphomicrobiales bacterium]